MWTLRPFVHNITPKKVQRLKKNIFLFTSLFFACHFEYSLLCTLNGQFRIFTVNFNYLRYLEISNMINFWLTSWVPLWWQIFFSFFFSLLFSLFNSVLNLAYFAPLNGAGRIFSGNLNYPRCLGNFNMIYFGW